MAVRPTFLWEGVPTPLESANQRMLVFHRNHAFEKMIEFQEVHQVSHVWAKMLSTFQDPQPPLPKTFTCCPKKRGFGGFGGFGLFGGQQCDWLAPTAGCTSTPPCRADGGCGSRRVSRQLSPKFRSLSTWAFFLLRDRPRGASKGTAQMEEYCRPWISLLLLGLHAFWEEISGTTSLYFVFPIDPLRK